MRFLISPHLVEEGRSVVEVWGDTSSSWGLIGAYYWNPITRRLLLMEKVFLNGDYISIDTAIFLKEEEV